MTKQESDADLVNGLLEAMQGGEADFTLTFRDLSTSLEGDSAKVEQRFNNPARFRDWQAQWRERLARENISHPERVAAMNRANPLYIPRNHKVEEALAAASSGDDLQPFRTLLDVIARPFDERQGLEDFTRPAPPAFADYRTFCGT
jgi:uncharacterized protein YdiU (UPF0061 family)